MFSSLFIIQILSLNERNVKKCATMLLSCLVDVITQTGIHILNYTFHCCNLLLFTLYFDCISLFVFHIRLFVISFIL